MARNIDRKQLKNPDQFVSFWTRAAASAGTHRRALIVGVVASVVAVFGVWGVTALRMKGDAASTAAFARIDKVASAALLPEKGEAPKADDGLPHFKTEKERLEAALKEVDAFLGAHAGSRLRDEALLVKARYLLAVQKPADAAAIYRELLSGHLDTRLRFLVQEGLGYSLEASNQADQAIAAFGAAADEAQKAGGFYRDRALYQKARLLEKKGDAKEAEKIFREVLDKTPTTPLRDEINDRLAAHDKK